MWTTKLKLEESGLPVRNLQPVDYSHLRILPKADTSKYYESHRVPPFLFSLPLELDLQALQRMNFIWLFLFDFLLLPDSKLSKNTDLKISLKKLV